MGACMLLNRASDRYSWKQKGTIFELLNVLIFFIGPVTYYNLPALQDKSFDGSSSFGGSRFITHIFTSCFILYNGLYLVYFPLFHWHFLPSGLNQNIVGYYSSWFENEHLYIQMELCDHSLSIRKCSAAFTEAQVLDALFQVNFLPGHF